MTVQLAAAEPIQAVATFYAIVGGNDRYWRVDAPARAVGAKVCALPENAEPTRDAKGRFNGREPSAAYSIMTPNDDSSFPWEFLVDRNDPDYWEIRFPEHEGHCAIWPRPDLARATIALAMSQRLGYRTVAEVDDNYLCDEKLNLFLRANHWTDDHRIHHLKAHASMTAVVFSTAWLRDRYEFQCRRMLGLKRNEMPEMYVCGNHVDEKDWPVRVERDGPVRVGWMGSPSHVWDVHLAYQAFAHAKRIGCETWMVGYNPAKPELSEQAAHYDKAKAKAATWATVVDQHVPWVKPERFQRFPLPFDIGLAPLLVNDFTLGKSDVKATEYAIAGAAPVLWNMPVYNKNWIHGETCLLVGSADEAWRAVDRLVRDENLRLRIVANAQQYVREERGLKQLREEWGAAIRG